MNTEKALIFSAPSGAGKTTIVKHLLQNHPKLCFSISACTRDRRGRNEANGKDYNFMTPEEFKQRIDSNEFVEWEEVYPGNFYGTLKSEIDRIWAQGNHVIFDVDVKGGLSLKNYFQEKALSIFVKVPSLDILKARLSERGTESEVSLSQRLFKARFEMGFEEKFDVSLINEKLEDSLAKADELYTSFVKLI